MNDASFGGPSGNRILIWDAHPQRISDYAEADHVIGQPDFETRTPGGGRKKFGFGELAFDDSTQLLFQMDSTNNRVMVFDIHPERIENYADAVYVIGQSDFDSKERGAGRNLFSMRTGFGDRPNGIVLDPERKHLYVSDAGNNRIMVFDVHPDRLRNKPDAIAVIGQPDFFSTEQQMLGASALPEERRGLTKATPGGLGLDYKYKRLFVSQPEENRILVFDVSELKQAQNPDAIAVVGQPDFTTFDPDISASRIGWPKSPVVDSEKQMLYLSEGYEGGNRVIAFDIHPDRLVNGIAAVDVIGHMDDRGRVDFEGRDANDGINGYFGAYVRSVELDPVGHRLFAADQYNNRVLVYQLDAQNRIFDREARWVFGQDDLYSAVSKRTDKNLRIPLALAYDQTDKRLYVGDSWNDRILVFDADPAHMPPGGGHAAVAVLGQANFTSQDPRATRNRLDFAITRGRGIASSLIPIGIAIDEKRRLAFVSDGGNNRVLVFDIHRERLRNGADAIAVLGQPDFTSKEIRLDERGMNSPGHLSYDPEHDRLFVIDSLHHRVLVFDVGPGKLQNGMAASRVLGQPDFTTSLPPQMLRRYSTQPDERIMPFPNGLSYDPSTQRLYLSHRGYDRVMVFDARPDRLENHSRAIAVLGQRDLLTHSPHIESDRSGQDQLYDNRGLAFDSKNQLLYVADSHFARIMAFNFPTSSREINLGPGGLIAFNSLDAYTVLNPPVSTSGYSLLHSVPGLRAGYALTRTRFEIEPLSQRVSRQLVSLAAASAPAAINKSVLYVEGRNGAISSIFVANPGTRQSSVEFVYKGIDGTQSKVSRNLQAGASLISTIPELLGLSSASGTLTVQGRQPVAVSAWYDIANRHDEKITALLPAVSSHASAAAVLPGVTVGGGYETDIVLLNAKDEPQQGTLVLFNEDGVELASKPYRLEPGGSLVWPVPDAGALPVGRYALTRPVSGAAPAISAQIRRNDNGLITTTMSEFSDAETYARVPLNTMPDLIRHRLDISTQLTLSNQGRIPAAVRFILRDTNGEVVDRHEQIIMAGLQRTFTLSGLFNRNHFAGTLIMVSDYPVGMSVRLLTRNLRGEEILTGLPLLRDSADDHAVLPYLDGNGISTEILVSADEEEPVQSRIEFFGSGGKAMDVIVR